MEKFTQYLTTCRTVALSVVELVTVAVGEQWFRNRLELDMISVQLISYITLESGNASILQHLTD